MECLYRFKIELKVMIIYYVKMYIWIKYGMINNGWNNLNERL